ncbi:protein FAR1-RELATED SEQUENCE 5-like [Cannabis sativa]|uniref:protein FAR1-RELATED SEQUENCE 5-like n=1 Tax=Cannabis sativa TaxID=3483 RepID=UPI0029C9E6AB|nr:protein FAR1-RELATED SEQUENCE 5-like [Cannabis sativa]
MVKTRSSTSPSASSKAMNLKNKSKETMSEGSNSGESDLSSKRKRNNAGSKKGKSADRPLKKMKQVVEEDDVEYDNDDLEIRVPDSIKNHHFSGIMNIDTNNEEQHSNNQRNEENQEATNDYAVKIMQIHSNIPDDEIPKVSMEFETEEQAYNFYNVYAYKVGFSIRRSKSHKDNENGKIKNRTFCCSCEGFREKDKQNDNVKCHRATTRFGCLARMKIKLHQFGKYQVIEFNAEHTHVTSSPNMSHLHRSQRRITPAQASEIEMAENSGIAPKASMELMIRRAGGHENLGFILDDCRNYIRTKRTIQMRAGDTGGVLEYLQKKKSKDPNFYYALQADEDDLLTNIFWADARMKESYYNFGDVVSFDTTYRKNHDCRPFAMFVGVNHHKQTTIFGAALLYDETTETFMWLFDTFVEAMSGKKPKTILTDQDAAMAKALRSQWPETYHRLCIWHMYQNAAKHLSSVFERFREFAHDFGNCIYEYDEECEFIEAWGNMLGKYNLENNDWLAQQFKVKEKWALVYGRDTFCANMTTTQRSESMNNVLKKYVSYQHTMLRFLEHFERLIDDRRYEELKADFRVSQRNLAPSLPIEILNHAANVYTPAVLRMFEVEFSKAYSCAMELITELGVMREYKLTPNGKSFHHTVKYDSSINTTLCSCKKFEFAGILCSHILKVFSFHNIVKIPSQYILKRWTKHAKMGVTSSTFEIKQGDDPKTCLALRYQDLSRSYTHIVTRASVIEKAYKLARDGFKRISDDVDACLEEDTVGRKEENCTDDRINTTIKGIKINNKRIRGSSSTRPKNALEKMRKKTKVSKKTVSTKQASQVFHNNDQVNNIYATLSTRFFIPDYII